MAAFPLEDFAYLEARNPHLKETVRPPYKILPAYRQQIKPPDIRAEVTDEEFMRYTGSTIGENGARYIDEPATAYLLGKGTRTISGHTDKVLAKCKAHEAKYEKLVESYAANR